MLLTKNMDSRRTDRKILLQILNTCANGNGELKTKIVYAVNLNFKTAKPYLDLLVRNGLLETSIDGRHTRYTTTTKGAEALEHLRALEKLLSDAARS